jgi:hypothetical protein
MPQLKFHTYKKNSGEKLKKPSHKDFNKHGDGHMFPISMPVSPQYFGNKNNVATTKNLSSRHTGRSYPYRHRYQSAPEDIREFNERPYRHDSAIPVPVSNSKAEAEIIKESRKS